MKGVNRLKVSSLEPYSATKNLIVALNLKY